jgi:hypothetical protein
VPTLHFVHGLYFGHVSDELFDQVVPHIVPPAAGEGFTLRPA